MFSGQKLINNLLGIEKIKKIDQECRNITNIRDSSSKVLEILEVDYNIIHGELAQIPNKGSLIIAANHPFGGIEGLILINLIARVRPDFKVIVTKMLSEIKILEKYTILVDVFSKNSINTKAIREAKKILDDNGVIIIFPAGEVSSYSIQSNLVIDPDWHKTLGYLAQKSQADIIPVNFSGRNSALFQALGLIHPLLRTSMLPREILNKQQQDIKLSIGKKICVSDWQNIVEIRQLTEFVKLSSYILDAQTILKPNTSQKTTNIKTLMSLPAWQDIYFDIKNAKSSYKILTNGDYEVFIVEGKDISIALQAIGIIREATFRKISEGTGEASDLDRFDKTYQHIILLHKGKQIIAGAYRLMIHRQNSQKESYAETLINLSKEFKSWLEPAVELGRAFVHEAEQKSPIALSLIWQGILQYMAQKGICKLYGTVSIPANISPLARELIMHYLHNKHYIKAPYGKIQAHHKVKLQSLQWQKLGLNSITSIKQMNWLLAQIEPKCKFPGLIKHYLKIGCKCYSFSRDPSFGDVIDCLFILDLKKQDSLLVKRFVGADIYNSWLKK